MDEIDEDEIDEDEIDEDEIDEIEEIDEIGEIDEDIIKNPILNAYKKDIIDKFATTLYFKKDIIKFISNIMKWLDNIDFSDIEFVYYVSGKRNFFPNKTKNINKFNITDLKHIFSVLHFMFINCNVFFFQIRNDFPDYTVECLENCYIVKVMDSNESSFDDSFEPFESIELKKNIRLINIKINIIYLKLKYKNVIPIELFEYIFEYV